MLRAFKLMLWKGASAMLDALRDWAEIHRSSFANLGVRMEITMGVASVNPGIRLDFDSSNLIGRITCWDSGDCDMEIIGVDTEKMIFGDHQTLTAPVDFDNAFRGFLQILGASA